MSGSVVDTNVLIKYLQGDARAVKALEEAGELFVPAIVMGELLYGVEKSRSKLDNYVLYTDFLAQFEILPIDKHVAESYSELKAQLFSRGINTLRRWCLRLGVDRRFCHPLALGACVGRESREDRRWRRAELCACQRDEGKEEGIVGITRLRESA